MSANIDREQLIADIEAGKSFSQGLGLGWGGTDRWGTQGTLVADPDATDEINRKSAEWFADQLIADWRDDQANRVAGEN